jgi:hypothetical protein
LCCWRSLGLGRIAGKLVRPGENASQQEIPASRDGPPLGAPFSVGIISPQGSEPRFRETTKVGDVMSRMACFAHSLDEGSTGETVD